MHTSYENVTDLKEACNCQCVTAQNIARSYACDDTPPCVTQALAIAQGREAALQVRLDALSQDAAALRSRAEMAEADAAAARRVAASGPDTALRDAVAVLEAENRALTSRLQEARRDVEAERNAHEATRAQLMRLAREVHRARKQARANSSREAARLRLAYVAAEERLVLDGDRAALAEIRRQLTESGSVPPPPPPPLTATAPQLEATSISSGVAALRAERRALVAADPLTFKAGHPSIRRLDRLITAAIRRPH